MKRNASLHTLFSAIALLALSMLWACEDDFNPGANVGIADGSITNVPFTIHFDPEAGIDLTSRAVSDAMSEQKGDAIQDINDFWIVIFNEDGTFNSKYQIRKDGHNVEGGKVSNVKYNGLSDNRLPSEGNLGDDAAGRLEFDLELPALKYYIYGVANVAGFDKMLIPNRQALKSIECQWDRKNIAANSEMFGIFSIGSNRAAIDDTPLTVKNAKGKAQQLHCWLRRLASKVTVAFDGSELYDNVEVYIDTIMVCDVAKKCPLGLPNHPGWINDEGDIAEPSARYTVENGVHDVGGVYSMQKMEQSDLNRLSPMSYYHVCNSSHIYGGSGSQNADSINVLNHAHAHTSKSLFFYENMQGIGKDKAQSKDGQNIDYPKPQENDTTSGWKDAKAYGTYVEVRAFYRSEAPDHSISSGWIRYRFMLGQDVKNNYDAVRNTHYKLTLKLRGYANDYDWHIDYKEEPGIHIITPQYISYLYNKSMYATVKVVGEMDPNYGLRAEIMAVEDYDKSNKFVDFGPWGDDKANADGEIEFPDPSGVKPDGTNLLCNAAGITNKYAKGPHTSFLSLKKSTVLRIEPDNAIQGNASWQTNEDSAKVALYRHFHNGDDSWTSEGKRIYQVDSALVPKNHPDGNYTMQVTRKNINYEGKSVAIERVFRIPFFTRPKELVTKSSFVGNNPYIAYPRKMRVKFTAKIRQAGESQYTETTFYLDMIQVRRIVNPKGIWRPAGSSDGFNVKLMNKPDDTSTTFRSFRSVGKWSAEVISQSDPIITLSSTTVGSGSARPQSNVRRVEGEDECPIDFMINFHGAQSGYAIVRVRYHNFTCEHDIFCWVGLEPVQINFNSTTKWRHTNVVRFEKDGKAVYANSPLQGGSFFRRGSNIAIAQTNFPVYDVMESSSNNPTFKVYMPGSATTTDATWEQCRVDNRNVPTFNDWNIANKNERIADCTADFYTVTSPLNTADFYIKKAYGVLYGPGANAPSTDLYTAYGYDSETGDDSEKGMLGVFVYNNVNCHTFFLPMGKSTHGRLKGNVATWIPSPKVNDGTLRYANRNAYFSGFLNSQPLFVDLYRRPGALYWCKHYYPDTKANTDIKFSSAFDINFYTMAFEGYQNGAVKKPDDKKPAEEQLLQTQSDGCFIRTVVVDP